MTTTMGLAIDYTLNLWSLLGVYLDDGRIEIDQNLVENVTQSFGLHFLCRGADNAEKEKTPKLYRSQSLGIMFALLN